MAKESNTPTNDVRIYPWSKQARLLASMLICWHVLAIFMGPWSMDGSALSRWLLPLFRPYLRAANLDHGYRFFAPEPGPAHLVRYEIKLKDGGKLEGEFPNLKEHQPRLLYHRHFMLSEFLNTLDSGIPNFADDYRPSKEEAMLRSRRIATRDHVIAAIANHLLQKYDAASVHIYLRRHLIPMPGLVASGVKLTDPRFFEELDLGEFPQPEGVAQPPNPENKGENTVRRPVEELP